MEKKVSFKMKSVGDVSVRKELGGTTSLEMFRIIRTCLAEVVNISMGEEAANSAMYGSGKVAGDEIHQNFLKDSKDLNDLVAKTTELLRTLKIGLFRVDKADVEKGEFLISVDECVSCSGTPNIGKPICYFEGGVIAGILEGFTGKNVEAKEIKCWAMGDQTCQFEVKVG